MIKDFVNGNKADGVYLVNYCQQLQGKNSSNYLNIVLHDKSGDVECKKWNAKPEDMDVFKKGNFVRIVGEVTTYKDKIQVRIDSGEIVNENELNFDDFIIPCPEDIDKLKEKLNYYLNSIKDPDCKKILDSIFDTYLDKYIEYPAGVKNHHEYRHGLLYHSLSMCDMASKVFEHYGNIDYDVLISGCLLHDIGKIVELSGVLRTSYTIEGNLLGHLAIGMSIIRETSNKLNIKGDKPILLEHMLLSHHGKPEFGSAVYPLTKEALILSMIDDLDAKITVIDKALNGTEKGEFTDKIFALENRSFYKSK